MDRLGILQKVYEHSKKMKARAVTETGACMYRTEDGNKCFIGCLFPDELYVPSCEGASSILLQKSQHTLEQI